MSSILHSTLPNPDPGFKVIVTKEEFNLFHSVDRQLFSRLVVGLGRETSESINVLAFFMWLERNSKEFNLVAKILHCWSDVMLGSLADEAVFVLNFIRSSRYPNSLATENKLTLIQHILRCNVTLDFFHEKRLKIITDVTKFINHVCVRAFMDIIEQLNYDRAVKEQELYLANVYGDANIPTNMHPQAMYHAANVNPMAPQQMVMPQFNELGGSTTTPTNNALEIYDASRQIKPDVSEILANLNLDDIYGVESGIVASNSYDNDKRKEIKQPIDDRTLFMTFSKGYPISENELRDFFKRQFGDIIDRVIMQEANPPEQSLYARLVVRPEAINVIDHFLDYNPRKKFTINGKHVWARKYIRKLPPAQPLDAAGTSQYFP